MYLQGVVVDNVFEEILDEIHETRPTFNITYDRVLPVHQDKYKEMLKVCCVKSPDFMINAAAICL